MSNLSLEQQIIAQLLDELDYTLTQLSEANASSHKRWDAITDLERRIKGKDEALAALKQQLAASDRAVLDMRGEVMVQVNEVTRHRKMLKALDERLTDMIQLRNEADKRAQATVKQRQALVDEKNALHTENVQLKAKVAEQDTQLEELIAARKIQPYPVTLKQKHDHFEQEVCDGDTSIV